MKKLNTSFALALFFFCTVLTYADLPYNFSPQELLIPVNACYVGGNSVLAPLLSNGILNNDRSQSTMMWPVTSTTRKSIVYSSGLWIGAVVVLPGNIRELRTAASLYNSMFTSGNIPVPGGIPPQSVCDDPSWKGTLVNLVDSTLIIGGFRNKTIGGTVYTILYDSWANWPVSKGAPYVEVNGIPGYQPSWNGDRPGIGIGTVRPSEICFMSYMDYTNCTANLHQSEISLPGGTGPLGVEIQQLVYSFSCPQYDRTVFYRWKIINKSSNVWDSTYIGIANDADVGDAGDDAAGSDSLREMAYMYNADNNDGIYGIAPPAVGVRQLQGPLVYSGNTADTVRLPYGIFVGYKMQRLNTATVFQNINDPCFGDPDNAHSGYNFLKGLDGCGNPRINPITGRITKFQYSGDGCNHTGWVDSSSSDRRTVQSSGPIVMNPGDTQVIVLAFIIGSGSNNRQSVCDMLNVSDFIRASYYSGLCSSIVGINPLPGIVPDKYALNQNYPNPFNPSTTIKFSLAGVKEQHVRLVIYDAIGQVVSTLINSNMKPGSYETDWDASFMPSGIYFYSIEAGSFNETKKMIVLK